MAVFVAEPFQRDADFVFGKLVLLYMRGGKGQPSAMRAQERKKKKGLFME
jgi:hypothetical protein